VSGGSSSTDLLALSPSRAGATAAAASLVADGDDLSRLLDLA
jgi:hypothetical protein